MGDGMIGEQSNKAPDLIERVIGYRAFVVALRSTGLELLSPFQREEWTEPTQTARCRRVMHTANAHMVGEKVVMRTHGPIPAPGCQCGIYSYYDVQHLLRMPYQEILLYALVTVEGRIQAHAKGMRSERMTVHALAPSERFNLKPGGITLANRLGVPLLESWLDLPNIAGEFGSPLPEDLRPVLPEKTKVPPVVTAIHASAARKRRRRDWRIWRG